jgi:hypothetical protein
MSWQRSAETKRRLKHLYEETKHTYGKGVWYDERKGRYIQYWASNGRTGRVKWVKRKCNRAVRRYKGDLPTKGSYRKVSEYWWEIW